MNHINHHSVAVGSQLLQPPTSTNQRWYLFRSGYYDRTHFNPQLLPTLVPTCSGPVGEAVVGPEHVRDAQEVLDRAQGAPYLKLEILKC